MFTNLPHPISEDAQSARDYATQYLTIARTGGKHINGPLSDVNRYLARLTPKEILRFGAFINREFEEYADELKAELSILNDIMWVNYDAAMSATMWDEVDARNDNNN